MRKFRGLLTSPVPHHRPQSPPRSPAQIPTGNLPSPHAAQGHRGAAQMPAGWKGGEPCG